MLNNQGCSARFRRDAGALSMAHNRRVVEGAASGDLDGNGFPDLVSVASFDLPDDRRSLGALTAQGVVDEAAAARLRAGALAARGTAPRVPRLEIARPAGAEAAAAKAASAGLE